MVINNTCYSFFEKLMNEIYVGDEVVIKAQALTGGRGLGHFKNGLQGGVHMVKTEEEAADLTKQMVKQTLVTKQTGEKGIQVSKVQHEKKV